MAEDPEKESSLADGELLSKILAGKRDFFGVLVKRYSRRLYRVVRAILQNDDDAEDVIQESFVRAFEHLHEFEGRALFSTWLTRIAFHLALNRKKQYRREAPLEMSDAVKCTAESSRGQEARVLRDELRRILEVAIYALPETYRLVFVMRHIEQMSTMETAICLGISKEMVKVRLVRARALLRRHIAVHQYQTDAGQ